jgi:hypothetical protein
MTQGESILNEKLIRAIIGVAFALGAAVENNRGQTTFSGPVSINRGLSPKLQ